MLWNFLGQFLLEFLVRFSESSSTNVIQKASAVSLKIPQQVTVEFLGRVSEEVLDEFSEESLNRFLSILIKSF